METMMITLSGYKITETIHESNRTIVYCGYRTADNQMVVLKTHKTEYPSPVELARFRHEYEIGHTVEGPGILKYYEPKEYKHGLVLITEDFGAVG